VNFHSTVAEERLVFVLVGLRRQRDKPRSRSRHTYVVMSVEFHVLLRVTDANGALATNSTDFRAVPPLAHPVGRIPAAAALILEARNRRGRGWSGRPLAVRVPSKVAAEPLGRKTRSESKTPYRIGFFLSDFSPNR